MSIGFVGEFGGHTNVAAIKTALVAVMARYGIDGDRGSPWYFPTPDEYSAVLGEAGFTVKSAVLIPRLTPIATDMSDRLETLAASSLQLAPENLRTQVINMKRSTC